MKVLLLGISGKISQLVAEELVRCGHQVVGIDRRAWPGVPQGIEIIHTDIRKRAAEEVFREHRPEVVIHMATVSHLASDRAEERDRINLDGTKAVFEHAKSYGVKQVIFVGRHTYYGAAADSPLYHSEDEPPRALSAYPELSDLVAADLYASQALWRAPELQTAVLRVCYTLGPVGHGTLATYLRGSRVPTVLGFDPLFQFIHEQDAARAVVLAVEKQLRGVYNVAGPQPMPLSTLIEQTGRRQIPIPEFIVANALGKFGLPKLARGAVTHLKYSIVIDGERFKQAVGFKPQFDELETAHQFQRAFPLPEKR